MSSVPAARPEKAAAPVFRVLVVDDDPDMAGFLARLLKQQGLQADIAHDGHVALEKIAASPPDMVLLDVQMPGPDGFEICRMLKSSEATALLPVVLVTALEDQDSRVRGIEAGADDFLSKPVRREELVARVKTLRRLHDTRKELEGRRLAAEVQEKESIRKAFSRYLSPRLAERVLAQGPSGGDVFRNLSHRTAVVALFADLRGFTRLSETVPVASIVPALADALDVSKESKEIQEKYGTGDKKFRDDGAPKMTENFLIARRLVEAGARVVSLNFSRWDHHGQNFQAVRQDGPLLGGRAGGHEIGGDDALRAGQDGVEELRDFAHRADGRGVGLAGRAAADQRDDEGKRHRDEAEPNGDVEREVLHGDEAKRDRDEADDEPGVRHFDGVHRVAVRGAFRFIEN